MITDNTYREVLINPASETGVNKLLVVSGFATATMASNHFKDLQELLNRKNIEIDLIVGMCPEEGIDWNIHNGFVDLCESEDVRFQCRYVFGRVAVHSKLYVWCQNNVPILAFAGSANYTQKAFSNNRKEILLNCEPTGAMEYFNEIESTTILCTHGEVEENILIHKNRWSNQELVECGALSENSDNKVILSLLKSDGDIHEKSGLNWGHRPSRNRNEAYIPVPIEISKLDFFPKGKKHFSVITDDGKQLILRLEQARNKAMTTPLSNALLGEYFRSRLNLASGAFISKNDLINYGRTNVEFIKIDEETFYLDFSV